MKRIHFRSHIAFLAGIFILRLLTSCAEEDTFSVSTANRLTFSTDTLKMDTTFSNVSTVTRSFWVYNHSGSGLRCSVIRLENGNSSKYRVNVDGTYLNSISGYKVNNIEIHDGDSIRVYVELTPGSNGKTTPQLVADNLIFSLESGIEQKVNLSAYSWDAILLNNVEINKDSTIAQTTPIVIYGGLKVDSGATLTIGEGTCIYFHNNAGIKVYGTLKTSGTAEQNITLRGDRLDNMFDYLPYDYTPGQWQGIHFYSSSYDNELKYTDLHSAYNGIICDSSDINRQKLTLSACTLHNNQGYGLEGINSKITAENTQITNTLKNCAYFNGGEVTLNNCTVAQFYPFDADRGVALRFSSVTSALTNLEVRNSLITGYADDEMSGEKGTKDTPFNYTFDHCIIRTPAVTTSDSIHFTHVTYENISDTTKYGEKNFVKIDTELLRYDFHLSKISPAVNAADPLTTTEYDRDGKERDGKPDIGAYERQ
ncbi:MAG TPA: hypothetical protein DCS83_06160 [Prevotella sp.]|nr:hypothetical protein [Prevotella sp.]